MQFEIISFDVTTECSLWPGCYHQYIEFNESKITICLKIPTVSSADGIVYKLLNGGITIIFKQCNATGIGFNC